MDWTGKQDKALEMIAKYGADISIVSVTRSTYSASLDSFATTATTTWTAKGLITEFAERDINGTTVQAGDRKVLIAAKGLPAIDTFDDLSILYGSIVWDPINISVLAPGGTPILYTVQVRG